MKAGGFFDKIENKVFMIIVLTTVASAIAIFTLLYNMYHVLMVDDIRARTRIVNRYAQDVVDCSSFCQLDTRADEASPIYGEVQASLNVIRQVANVRYLFTAKKDSDGKLIYLVDGLDIGSSDFRHVGDPIEPEITDRLNSCLSGQRVEADDVVKTEWGAIFATCWPVEQDGAVIGAVFMEFDAENFYQRNVRTTVYSISASIFIAAVFIFLARLFLARVSEPFYKKLAYTDLLTGVGNRNAFELDLRQHEAALKNGGQPSFFIVAYDLNRLKEVNDRFGHNAGDAYIKRMAALLREAHFGAPVQHYRIGGDEFASVLMGGDANAVRQELDRLFTRTHKPLLDSDFFEFSYGIGRYEAAQDRNLHDVLARADVEMYRFKKKTKAGTYPVMA